MGLRRALDIYGFLFKFSSSAKPNNLGDNLYLCVSNSNTEGPPQNIRAWIKCITACCLIRWLPVVELALPEDKGDMLYVVAWAPNIGRGTPSQSLFGTLSSSIGNLTNVQIV
ncbi:hypothetical protein JHK82_045038 [Glycine max]|nr:hypothetical protein JHK85_046035 [Glycine max]KAG5099986.1 hypothetical protein JHK82_045038 [Glycine max]KAG5108588.1 hypothetical protein JHK84_045495 [Glycine max]